MHTPTAEPQRIHLMVGTRASFVFFDNWVIPLAQNLKECGVLDILSDHLVKQAQSNRQRWQLEGKQLSKELRCDIKSYSRMLKRSQSSCDHSLASTEDSSSAAASYLASQMVTEAESLSKVMARYEHKYKASFEESDCAGLQKPTIPNGSPATSLSDVHITYKIVNATWLVTVMSVELLYNDNINLK